MFKDERRGQAISHLRAAMMRLPVVIGFCLFMALAQLAPAEDAAEPAEPADVVIATDMDEPAKFVPHRGQALDLDLDLIAENPFKDDGGEAPPETDLAPLASPGDRNNLLRQPNPIADSSSDAASAGRKQAEQLMQRAHGLAKAAMAGEDFAAVIELCNQGEASAQWEAGERYFRNLAAWAHNRRGEQMVQLGQAADALAEFDRAVQLDPENWRAAHNRGVSRAEKGELAKAASDFSHVIRLKADYSPAYRNRGEVYFATGRYADAVDDYTQAMAYTADTGELHFLRASALHQLGFVSEALADYDASMRSGRDDLALLLGRSAAHAELSDYAAAIADLDKAIKLVPNSAEAYRAVAWILATCPEPRYRRPDKAVLAARHALELQGRTDPAFFDTLAAAYAAAEDFEQAKVIQDQAVQLASDMQEKQILRTRLALYHQNRPYLSGKESPSAAAEPAVQQPIQAADRSAGPSGLRQPSRIAAPGQ